MMETGIAIVGKLVGKGMEIGELVGVFVEGYEREGKGKGRRRWGGREGGGGEWEGGGGEWERWARMLRSRGMNARGRSG